MRIHAVFSALAEASPIIWIAQAGNQVGVENLDGVGMCRVVAQPPGACADQLKRVGPVHRCGCAGVQGRSALPARRRWLSENGAARYPPLRGGRRCGTASNRRQGASPDIRPARTGGPHAKRTMHHRLQRATSQCRCQHVSVTGGVPRGAFGAGLIGTAGQLGRLPNNQAASSFAPPPRRQRYEGLQTPFEIAAFRGALTGSSPAGQA